MSNAIYLLLGTAAMVLMMFTIILFVYFFQRKLSAKARAYNEIEKLMQKQELSAAYSLINGQEQERQRIAADVHDNIGGLLSTLKIYSDLSLEKKDLTEVNRLNYKINNLSEQLSLEVRKLSHQLDLRTLSGFGIKVAVQQLCEAINESGNIEVLLLLDMQQPISDQIALNLYRIVQELFTNTLKHAQATKVRLEIALIRNDITVIYEDNGKGFDPQNPHSQGMGLTNIRSRANIIGAKLTLESSDKGTTVILEIMNHD